MDQVPLSRGGAALPRATAVVVGVDDYSRGICPLRSAVADATAVAQALENDHGHRPVHLLLNGDAGRAAVLAAIDRVVRETDEATRVVLYFAGHGVARGDGAEGPEGYLLPHGADPDEPSTWLSMQDLRQALERLSSRHLLVILDCCFAGSFRWSATRSAVPTARPLYDSQFDRYLAGRAWQVLSSAAHDEKALDLSPGRGSAPAAGHSPFAAALLAALAGGADSSRGSFEPDGVMTATEIHQFIFQSLVPDSAAAPQTPGLWSLDPRNSGEYLFATPGSERNTRPDPPLVPEANPWRGLAAYDEDQVRLFFGRERAVRELRERLEDAGAPAVVAVIGAAGTGKSSVLRAGLLPALSASSPAWRIVFCESAAGGDPRHALREALARLDELGRTPGRRLLVIERLEELFAEAVDDGSRDAFFAQLAARLAAVGPELRVLLTVRAEFEPLLSTTPLGPWISAGRYRVAPFSPEELRRVIEGPAAARALYFEPPELVDELVDEVVAMPGGLPLLSFALAEIYRRAVLRRRRTGALDRALTREDVRAVGGVVGAVERRADELAAGATGPEGRGIRWLLLRMVGSEGGRSVRRRVHRRELEPAEGSGSLHAAAALDALLDARLVVLDRSWIEPAHDSLVEVWPRLRRWVEETAVSRPLLRSAWRAATAWDGHGRDPRRLWHRDPRLALLEELRPEHNRLEREFLVRSVARRRRRRRIVAAVVGSTMAVLGLLSAISWQQAGLARSRLRAAITAVGEIDTTINDDLRPVAGAAAVRRSLQEKTGALLETLLSDEADEPEVLYRRAFNRDNRGELLYESGRVDEARSEFAGTVALLEPLMAETSRGDRRRIDWGRQLAAAHHHLSWVHESQGDLEGARAELRRAIARSGALAEEFPERSELRRDVAVSVLRGADLSLLAGELAAAGSGFREAVEQLELLAAEGGAQSVAHDLEEAHGRLAALALQEGRWDDSRREAERILASVQLRLAEAPDHQRVLSDLAQAFHAVAQAALGQGRPEDAREALRSSIGRLEELWRREPDNLSYGLRLASAWSDLANAFEVDQFDARGHALRQAIDVAADILERAPENLFAVRSIAASRLFLGQLEHARGDRSRAVEELERSAALLEGWPEVAWEASYPLQALSEIARGAGDLDAARRYSTRSIETLVTSLSQVPGNEPARRQLMQAWMDAAELAGAAGDSTSSLAALTRAVDLGEELTGRHGERQLDGLRLATALVRRANVLSESNPEEAARLARRAQRLFDGLDDGFRLPD